MSDSASQPMERDLSEIRRLVEVGFASQGGKLDLVLHRLDQQDRRSDAHEARLDRLDERQDGVERDYVPRTELVREITAARTEMSTGIAAVRTEASNGIAAVRAEASNSKNRLMQVAGPTLAAIAIAVSIIMPLATGK